MKKKSVSWSMIALLGIIIVAIFVRTYRFDDFLYFKMDQSRDALMIANAVENGPQYLPLLGPRVGAVKLEHGMLRVGPIFYYFQYLAGVIFHSTQAYVFAYPDLFFSILAIPLLFLLSRIYFSRLHSLLITAMYAFSFLIIQYSRFAWNPNSMQFFVLLSFYGLLRFLSEENEKKKRKWLALWALGISIGMQLHFFGFFSLIGVSGLLIVFHLRAWEKKQWLEYFKKDSLKKFSKYAAIVVLVFGILYSPVIISDVFRHGENTHNFFEALVAKPAPKPLTEKISKSVSEDLKYYCLLTTSECYQSNMKKDIPAILLTAAILLGGIILVVRGLRKEEKIERRNFLALLLIWFGVFMILTIPVAFQLRPRFFIIVFAIPFVCLGLFFEYLQAKMKNRNYALALAVLITTGIVGLNFQGTYQWFKEQTLSQKKAVAIKRTLILKAKDGVTLGQLQNVTDWMYARHKQGSTLYYYVKPEHVRPITFLLWEKHDKNMVSTTMTINSDPNAEYFAITPAKNGLEAVYKKYPKNNITLIAQQQFGQLLVSEIAVNDRSVSPNFRFNKSGKKSDRIFWKDVFDIKDEGNKAGLIDGEE